MVKFVSHESDVKLGDIFVTSGIGNFYAPGYSVGKVRSIDETLDASFLTIYLEPTQNINKLELVLVVKEKND